MKRRDFLFAGTAAAVPLGLRAAGTDGATSTARTALGWWAESEHDADLGRSAGSLLAHQDGAEVPLTLVEGTAVPRDDRAPWASGAQLTVHGLRVAEPSWARPELQALTLDIDFARAGVEFQAWEYRRRPIPCASSPLAFEVPLDGASLLLRLTRSESDGVWARRLCPASAVRSESRVAWTAGDAPGRPRLRRGVWVLASAGAAADAFPGWDALESASAGSPPLARRDLLGPRPVDFDYVVLSVEPAAG